MVSDVTVFIGADSTAVLAEVSDVKSKIDAVVDDWANKRRQIILGLSAINSLMTVTTRIANKVADETGRALVRVLNSLLSVVTTTVSTMIATAAGLAATGILAPVAAALAGFAAGFSIGQTAAILQTEAIVLASMVDVTTRLSALEIQAQFRGQQGGFG